MTTPEATPDTAEARFGRIFEHLDAVAAYAARRGSHDPEAIAAETMTIAWRRLTSVPADDPRPWLFVTARNLLMAERRRAGRRSVLDARAAAVADQPQVDTRDPAVTAALRDLTPADREALVLVAWDDLAPSQAAAALGVSPVAFRVRLHRARRRFAAALATHNSLDHHRIAEVKSS